MAPWEPFPLKLPLPPQQFSLPFRALEHGAVGGSAETALATVPRS